MAAATLTPKVQFMMPSDDRGVVTLKPMAKNTVDHVKGYVGNENNPFRWFQWTGITLSSIGEMGSAVGYFGKQFGAVAGVCAISGALESAVDIYLAFGEIVSKGFTSATTEKLSKAVLSFFSKLADFLISAAILGAIILGSAVIYVLKLVKDGFSSINDVLEIIKANKEVNTITEGKDANVNYAGSKEKALWAANTKVVKASLALAVHGINFLITVVGFMFFPTIGMTALILTYLISIAAKHFLEAQAKAATNTLFWERFNKEHTVTVVKN